MSIAEARIGAVRDALTGAEIDALVVDEPGNRRWLTSFTGSAGSAIVTRDAAFLLTDSRYYGQAERQAPDFELVRAGAKPLERLCGLLEEHNLHRVGFEADVITVGRFQRLQKQAPGVDWTATRGLVEDHRVIKTDAEIAQIAACVALGDRAMEHAYAIARPGMTERELAWELERFMRDQGADGMAFAIIVAAGENSALPHHTPGDRVIGTGEPIVIDLGPNIGGYNGDLTRTFTIGAPSDPEYETVYRVVAEANRAAEDGARAGLTGREVDALARDVITRAGYGEHFGHGLGHGVGLNVHEMPRVSPAADDGPLKSGMVITIEPGVYLPGRFGVRIEDLVVVRDEGTEVLTAVVKQPTIEPA